MGATGFSMPYLGDKETGKIKDNPTFEEVHGGEVQEQGDRGWDGDQGVVPIGRIQVAEIYSPERVTKVAQTAGMEVGLSMDLTTGWNSDKTEDREMAERYIREYKPTFLIGSPMCTMF